MSGETPTKLRAAAAVVRSVRGNLDELCRSGSQPGGDATFAALAKLGVKTIISVDGRKPDVEGARTHGLRYIHLPFGYDGVSDERMEQLAQAAKAATGPIFVHCHHGKHRGPAAVGIVCETTEGWTPEQAEAWLRQAGTSPDYVGLFRSVREYQIPSLEKLAKLDALPEFANTEALVDSMVAIDSRFDQLKALEKAGWKPPTDQSGLAPLHEAVLLWEQYREIARTDDTARRPDDYRAKLATAERSASALRVALGGTPPDFRAASAALKGTSQQCEACHKAHRNEKR